jgi:hypothetical protein
MEDTSDRILRVISEFEEVADGMSPEEAARALEEPALQLFWRQWPHISSWAGSLWRLLNEDIVDPATAPSDDLDEVGEGG